MSDQMRSVQIGGHRVMIPPDASASEAAAISAAMGAHIRDQQAAAAADDGDARGNEDGWTGRHFAFAGRLDGVGIKAGRVPRGVPTDSWTAAGRADRY